jgi:hypothetical protein
VIGWVALIVYPTCKAPTTGQLFSGQQRPLNPLPIKSEAFHSKSAPIVQNHNHLSVFWNYTSVCGPAAVLTGTFTTRLLAPPPSMLVSPVEIKGGFDRFVGRVSWCKLQFELAVNHCASLQVAIDEHMESCGITSHV